MIQFYDNQGESEDRYTMAVYHKDKTADWYSFSTNALAPDGINCFQGRLEEGNTSLIKNETTIMWCDLPLSVQIACLQRLNPLE